MKKLCMAVMVWPVLGCTMAMTQPDRVPIPIPPAGNHPAPQQTRIMGHGFAAPGALLLASPGKRAAVVLVLQASTPVEVLDYVETGITETRSDLWWFVRSGGQTGWLSSDHFIAR